MKVALVNQPLGNRGDESAHRAFVNDLIYKFKDMEIDVIFINQNQERIDEIKVISNRVRYINIVGIRKASNYVIKLTIMNENLIYTYLHPLLLKYYKQIKKYDFIICAPGGICMGGFMNWSHVWQLYVAMRLHKKIIYWGRSIGPFSDKDKSHTAFKRISSKLINYFEYISLRDEVSYQLAKSIRPTSKLTVDSAFLTEVKVEVPTRVKDEIGECPYVVFVPNELKWHYKYKSVNQEAIERFYLKIIGMITEVYPQAKIVMLPQTYKSVVNDHDYFLKLRALSNWQEKIVVLDEDLSSDIQQVIIKRAIFLVGARYHSVIFAINNSVPFLSLSYEHKMRGVLNILELSDRQFDMEEFLLTGKDIDEQTCVMLTHQLCDDSSIVSATERAKRIVRKAFDEMVEELR